MENNNKIEQEKRINELKKKEKNELRLNVLKRTGLWGGVIVAMVLMVWGLARLGAPAPATVSTPLTEQVSPADHTKGNPLAKVTLVEYSDFQCPACGVFYPYVKAAEKKYSGEVLFVYRHFPLPTHDKSDLTARVSEAAGKQGKFWEMHDKLFETQRDWTAAKDAENIFTNFAIELGLNKERFLADLNDPALIQKINNDRASGDASGLQGTPTFYLNGKMIVLQSYDQLESSIAAAVAESR